MTAETGTYRWMAPEVCNVKIKTAVFLFGILILNVGAEFPC